MNQNIIIINRDHKNYDFPKITVPKSSYIAKIQISIFLMQQIKNVLLGAGKIIKKWSNPQNPDFGLQPTVLHFVVLAKFNNQDSYELPVELYRQITN